MKTTLCDTLGILGAGQQPRPQDGCLRPQRPNSDASGNIDSMDLLAGQSVGLVREVKPAGQIVRELVDEARQIISQRLAGCVATPTQG
jgi:NAD(P)H-dependent flavin oxidoreductase YrpB (nitropropane dioxygenase family)